MTSQITASPQADSYNGDHAIVALKRIKTLDITTEPSRPSPVKRHLPRTSEQRLLASLQESPFDLHTSPNETLQALGGGPENPDTVLYLAYGSNLSAETFQGKRGIRPISQLNVVVPDLVMTFDLAGIPYVEPCFANTKYRTQPPSSNTPEEEEKGSQSPLLPSLSFNKHPKYHKARWPKGLVGVVYEVTKADYAHIIATEGGGASYHDILISCHELPAGISTVPAHPTSTPFKAHTLFSPALPGGSTYNSRPDPDYAQPSARYLKLITDGADEHVIPSEYKTYLHELQPYTITTQKQRLGQWIFVMTWLPIITFMFSLTRMFADKKGRSPKWLAALTGAVFGGVWASYDYFFKRLFGDGERTIHGDEGGSESGEVYREDRVGGEGQNGRVESYGAVAKREGEYCRWV